MIYLFSYYIWEPFQVFAYTRISDQFCTLIFIKQSTILALFLINVFLIKEIAEIYLAILFGKI
jgi:hypothetical protein